MGTYPRSGWRSGTSREFNQLLMCHFRHTQKNFHKLHWYIFYNVSDKNTQTARQTTEQTNARKNSSPPTPPHPPPKHILEEVFIIICLLAISMGKCKKDVCISIANALQLRLSCTKSSVSNTSHNIATQTIHHCLVSDCSRYSVPNWILTILVKCTPNYMCANLIYNTRDGFERYHLPCVIHGDNISAPAN